jgi:regulator of RNase E activity RraB
LILVISPTDEEDGSKVWNVEAGIQRTLVDAGSERVTEELVRLAAELDAIYDGWGASI